MVMPDDAAIEKSQVLEALGATVQRVRPVSITHPRCAAAALVKPQKQVYPVADRAVKGGGGFGMMLSDGL